MRKKSFILVCGLLIIINCSSFLKAAEDTYYDFRLFTGYGERAMGMGGAYTAIADDASAIYWNPAGLDNIKQKELTANLGQETQRFFIAYAHSLKKSGTLGISIYAGIGFIYDYLVPNIIGWRQMTRILSGSVISVSYGKNIGDKIDIGASIKYAETHYRDEYDNFVIDFISIYRGWGIDVGTIYKLSKDIHIALVVQNLSKGGVLPLYIKCGVSWKALNNRVVTGLDLNMPDDENAFITIGIEYNPIDWLSLRTGYNTRARQNQGLHFGAGINIGGISVNWTLTPTLIGRIHAVSLAWRFGYKSE